jgi:hypothetical protein
MSNKLQQQQLILSILSSFRLDGALLCVGSGSSFVFAVLKIVCFKTEIQTDLLMCVI